MPKLSKPFELVVTDVLRAMDPISTVRQGEWIVGPDGADVLIEGRVDGKRHRVLVECKDYNPSVRPVGVGHVDALDSKRRDLGIDVSFISSNAGFTADAMRKAKRVGIGLIGVLREADPRVRYQVVEPVYMRRVTLEGLQMGLLHGDASISLQGVPFEAVEYQGLPLGNWVLSRAMLLIASNPVVQGSYSASHKLRRPVHFEFPSGSVLASRIDIHLTLGGGWFVQQIALDATCGVVRLDQATRSTGSRPGGAVHAQERRPDRGRICGLSAEGSHVSGGCSQGRNVVELALLERA